MHCFACQVAIVVPWTRPAKHISAQCTHVSGLFQNRRVKTANDCDDTNEAQYVQYSWGHTFQRKDSVDEW